jgi:serine/threonine protein kinase
LLFEDPGGETLDRFLSGAVVEMTQFLRFTAGLPTPVGGLDERKLIHKDVKPTNTLVNSVMGHVRLIGFGITLRLRRELQAPEPPDFMAGTLPDMAPEHTGRMNRSVAERERIADLGPVRIKPYSW